MSDNFKMGELCFTLVISNKDSETMYAANTASSFCVELPYVIRLPGNWKCGIESGYATSSLSLSPPPCVHILLDFVRPSIAYGKELRIGGTFPYQCTSDNQAVSFESVSDHTVQVEKTCLERIYIDILTPSLEHCSFLTGHTVIVLTFTSQNGE